MVVEAGGNAHGEEALTAVESCAEDDEACGGDADAIRPEQYRKT
jgi:hypothetical protein